MKSSVIYKQTNECTISVDVYYHHSKAPVIIYIHGGALIFGSRNWLPLVQVEYFRNAGFNIISIDYRLSQKLSLNILLKISKMLLVG